ncbi:MAG: hypothetical protein LQ337_006523 [Flavoplaca oasis]|nr:MAG: hypothetical protein LQ337_006523 [Flavoplaca oasis]
MLSISFITILFAASGICAPLYSAQEASAGTLSTIEKRLVTWTSWSGCSDANDVSTCKETKTWTEGGGDRQRGGGGFVPQEQGSTTTESTSNDSNEPTDNVENTPTEGQVEEEEPTTQPTSSDSSDSTSTNTTPSSDSNALLTVINKWRTAYGISQLTWSEEMVAGAAQTGQDNMGYFNSGSFTHGGAGNAEVMTPGSDTAGDADLGQYTPFEIAYISWLCEVPSETLGNACADAGAISPM